MTTTDAESPKARSLPPAGQFGPWHVYTKYPDEEQWQQELVSQKIPLPGSPSTTKFSNWWQLQQWFQLLENDLRNSTVEIRIVPLPAAGAKNTDSPSPQTDHTSGTSEDTTVFKSAP